MTSASSFGDIFCTMKFLCQAIWISLDVPNSVITFNCIWVTTNICYPVQKAYYWIGITRMSLDKLSHNHLLTSSKIQWMIWLFFTSQWFSIHWLHSFGIEYTWMRESMMNIYNKNPIFNIFSEHCKRKMWHQFGFRQIMRCLPLA